MVTSTAPTNYLIESKVPEKTTQKFYQFEKLMKMDYGQVWGPETHLQRRKLILQKHPEIKKLLLPNNYYSVILAVLMVSLGMAVCYWVKDKKWVVFLPVMYIGGATICHTCHVLIHDFTHYLGHKSIAVNKIMAMFCNIPMALPSAMSFGKYHANHHNFFSLKEKDPDLPVDTESNWVKKNKLNRFLYWFFISAVYALRPMVFYRTGLTRDEIVNVIFIVFWNVLIWKYWGANALLYMLLCVFFSIGPHPAAAHIIAEHYEFVAGQESYDYQGPFNFLNLNVGYHIEHHDFPTCPWYNLKAIRQTAPQFYSNLPYHTSYFKLLGKFLFDFKFNLFNRTIRIDKEGKDD